MNHIDIDRDKELIKKHGGATVLANTLGYHVQRGQTGPSRHTSKREATTPRNCFLQRTLPISKKLNRHLLQQRRFCLFGEPK